MKKRLLALMMLSIMALGNTAYAASDTTENLKAGETVTLTVYSVSDEEDSKSASFSRSMANDIDGVIEYMHKMGWEPGSTFYVGNKEYNVTDDYQIIFMGVDDSISTDRMTDNKGLLRGSSIPTRKGTLPYSSTYNISNYMYSSRYFEEYVEGDYASVAFVVSPDTANQRIKISWMDGRNDESMGNKTKTLTSTAANQLIGMDWVYGGEKFYFKITNMGSSKISGDWEAYVDQYGL